MIIKSQLLCRFIQAKKVLSLTKRRWKATQKLPEVTLEITLNSSVQFRKKVTQCHPIKLIKCILMYTTTPDHISRCNFRGPSWYKRNHINSIPWIWNGVQIISGPPVFFSLKFLLFFGGPHRSRTHNLTIRSRTLYPVELAALILDYFI